MPAPSFDELPATRIGPIETNWFLDDQMRPIIRSYVTVMRDGNPFTASELYAMSHAMIDLIRQPGFRLEIKQGVNYDTYGYIDFEVVQWKE